MNQWRKGIAQWKCGGTLYLSVPFTWLMPEAEEIARACKGKVVAGGPAVDLMGADWAETPSTCPFDTLAMHNPCATYTTRGCPNRCEFCAVPKIEGEFRELQTWKPAPMVCDNNILAASKRHFERVIDSLLPFPFVDFQGCEPRLVSPWHVDQMARLKSCIIRFGFDDVGDEGRVGNAVVMLRKAGLKNIRIYVLMGFYDTPEDALYRLELVRSWGLLPTPMRFQPLDTLVKNSYVAPGWTDLELRRITRYYSRLIHLGHIPFSDYQLVEAGQQQLFQEG